MLYGPGLINFVCVLFLSLDANDGIFFSTLVGFYTSPSNLFSQVSYLPVSSIELSVRSYNISHVLLPNDTFNETTYNIGIQEKYEVHHGVCIMDGALI